MLAQPHIPQGSRQSIVRTRDGIMLKALVEDVTEDRTTGL